MHACAEARGRHAADKAELDIALMALLQSATRNPGIVAAAFWLHSDAFKAAATALDNQAQALAPVASQESLPPPYPSSVPTKAGLPQMNPGTSSYPLSQAGTQATSVPTSGMNSPRGGSVVGSGSVSRQESYDEEGVARPAHITNIYEQSKARQQQRQSASETGQGAVPQVRVCVRACLLGGGVRILSVKGSITKNAGACCTGHAYA